MLVAAGSTSVQEVLNLCSIEWRSSRATEHDGGDARSVAFTGSSHAEQRTSKNFHVDLFWVFGV
jgi:hypothetical protein